MINNPKPVRYDAAKQGEPGQYHLLQGNDEQHRQIDHCGNL